MESIFNRFRPCPPRLAGVGTAALALPLPERRFTDYVCTGFFAKNIDHDLNLPPGFALARTTFRRPTVLTPSCMWPAPKRNEMFTGLPAFWGDGG